MIWWIISIAILIVLVFIYYFNRLVVLSNRIDNSLSQIDVQLKKRADLVPNLLESVKGYAKHEKNIIKEVTDARKALLGAQTLPAKMKAGSQLETALKSIFAIAENYPKLRANENFLQLQNELSVIEDKIAYARQFYNDSILSYNNTCTTFPGVIFARLYNKAQKPFLQIPKEERAIPKVKFD
ncbi:MAG: LemA family protein [Candidatus Pacearchaeota archaeon]|nr:LemA family protein [Candidatus Pacearchaeota archaeon]